MEIGRFNIPFNLLKCEKGSTRVTPQHTSTVTATSWPDCGMLHKPLHFADAQKSLFAAYPYGEHWTRVSVGSFVLTLYLLRCTGDSRWLDCKTRRFLHSLFSAAC